MKQEFERIEKHLYRCRYETSKGEAAARYYAIFTDWKQKRRSFPLGEDQARARDKLGDLRRKNDACFDFDLAKRKKEKELTFSQWVDRYLILVKGKKSWDRDRQHCDHLKAFFGSLPLGKITRSRTIEYKHLRLSEAIVRNGDPVEGRVVQISTVNRELSCLRHMLKLANEEGLIEAVPTINLESEAERARERILSGEEWKRLLDASPRWLQRCYIGAYESCLSRADLIKLTWEEVDRKTGLIRIKGGRTKTGARQIIPITPALGEVLAELASEFKRIPNTENRVFTKNGKPIGAKSIRKPHDKACRDARIKDFRFHDFRHMAKTRWAEMGVPVEAAMLAAGHKSLAMHYRYVNLQENQIRKAFENLLKSCKNENEAEEGSSSNPLNSQRGGVAERFKAPVLKTGVHFVDREFESRPLRQNEVQSNER